MNMNFGKKKNKMIKNMSVCIKQLGCCKEYSISEIDKENKHTTYLNKEWIDGLIMMNILNEISDEEDASHFVCLDFSDDNDVTNVWSDYYTINWDILSLFKEDDKFLKTM